MEILTSEENRDLIIRGINEAGLEALSLGYKQVVGFFFHLAACEPLCQVVLKGGLVQDVHDLPDEILLSTTEWVRDYLYELLDYDNHEEVLADLVEAFAKLEWRGSPDLSLKQR